MKLYSIKEAAVELGINKTAVYKWIQNGELQAYNLGRSDSEKNFYKISEQQLQDFLDARMLNIEE